VNYPGEASTQAMQIALMDEEARMRRTAVEFIQSTDPQTLAKQLANMLYDPVKTVRIEAARRLAGGLLVHLDNSRKALHKNVLQEYETAMKYSADFSFARHNLANLYSELGRGEDAIEQFKAALRIDNQFYPAKVNLAIAYNQQGKNQQAEKLLREVMAEQPGLHEVAYSFGLSRATWISSMVLRIIT